MNLNPMLAATIGAPAVVRRNPGVDRHALAEASAAVDISLARSAADLHSAFRLVYEQYLTMGYQNENASWIRFLPYFALPTSHTLIAKVRGAVVGAVTLVLDGALGLPMEKYYTAEVGALRQSRAKLAEATALVTKESRDPRLLRRMFNHAYLYALNLQGVTDMCFAVTGKHVPFYQRAYLCEPMSGPIAHGGINGKQVSAIRMNLATARQCYENAHSKSLLMANIFLAQHDLEQLRRDLSPPSREDIKTRFSFAQRHLDWDALDPDSEQAIMRAYDAALNDGCGFTWAWFRKIQNYPVTGIDRDASLSVFHRDLKLQLRAYPS